MGLEKAKWLEAFWQFMDDMDGIFYIWLIPSYTISITYAHEFQSYIGYHIRCFPVWVENCLGFMVVIYKRAVECAVGTWQCWLERRISAVMWGVSRWFQVRMILQHIHIYSCIYIYIYIYTWLSTVPLWHVDPKVLRASYHSNAVHVILV